MQIEQVILMIENLQVVILFFLSEADCEEIR